MSEHIEAAARNSISVSAPSDLTPAGLQYNIDLAVRRAVIFALTAAVYAGLLWAMAQVLGAGDWTIVDIVTFACLAIAAPWMIVGFWNAAIGLWLVHVSADGLKLIEPFAAAGETRVLVRVPTAVVMTVRNENAARAILRLQTIKQSLDRTGCGGAFAYFLLSDTSDSGIAAAEKMAMSAWSAREPNATIIYRRRPANTGYKAGNIHDFCERWGRDYELMLLLDADSLMSGEAIVRLTRIMQAHPRIGILQHLIVGLPTDSPFARIFQFGMRHGMRAYTVGHSWWTGDCGPFWGHNALIRVKPYHEECQLPVLSGTPPFGGIVLSHDQMEATLMRRAGYEVRVLVREDGSWEENPPTLLDFSKREMRWCQGNLQYLRLLDLPGLRFVSRVQLGLAALMFLGMPAWTLMVALLPFATWQAQDVPDYPAEIAASLYIVSLSLCFAPKIAGLIDAALTPGGVASYGGTPRFLASAAVEVVFSFLQAAVTALRTSFFIIGLILGRSAGWTTQFRSSRELGWQAAAQALWPQVLFGVLVCAALLSSSASVLLWSLPLTLSYLLAIPFAVLTSKPAIGHLLVRSGICGVPEDFDPPPEIVALENANR